MNILSFFFLFGCTWFISDIFPSVFSNVSKLTPERFRIYENASSEHLLSRLLLCHINEDLNLGQVKHCEGHAKHINLLQSLISVDYNFKTQYNNVFVDTTCRIIDRINIYNGKRSLSPDFSVV